MFYILQQLGKFLSNSEMGHVQGSNILHHLVWNDPIHILPNISRKKDNQATKFGQLIEYYRNIFVEKSYTKCGGETIPRLFPKKSRLVISLDQ